MFEVVLNFQKLMLKKLHQLNKKQQQKKGPKSYNFPGNCYLISLFFLLGFISEMTTEVLYHQLLLPEPHPGIALYWEYIKVSWPFFHLPQSVFPSPGHLKPKNTLGNQKLPSFPYCLAWTLHTTLLPLH